MPTYEYGCKACGHQFERRQSIKDDPIKDCPECGKPEASRMISQGNFILKGGGWYSDLYAGPSNHKSDGEAKPEAKPEAKADGDGGKSNGKDAKPSDGKASEGKSESKPSESKPASEKTGSKGGESTSAS